MRRPPSLPVAILLLALAVVLSTTSSRQAAADVVKTVYAQIVNDPKTPIPTVAQGTTNVSGSVCVSCPVPTRSEADHADAVRLTGFFHPPHNVTLYTVPDGKRLVVEHVGFIGQGIAGQVINPALVVLPAGQAYPLVGERQDPADGASLYRVSQALRITVDAGGVVQGAASGVPFEATFMLDGYLVDL